MTATAADWDWLKNTFLEWGGLVRDDRAVSPREDEVFETDMKRGAALIEGAKTIASDSFDLGFKAAGGTMIPDEARNVVELALTREQIEALASAGEIALDGRLHSGRNAELVEQFLETISIYRSKK